MSIEATLHVWKLSKNLITSFEKLVFLSLADRANEQFECWPSAKRLMNDTNADIKTIYSALDSLRDKGFIKKTGELKGRTKSVPVYRIIGIHGRENSTENTCTSKKEAHPKTVVLKSEAHPKTGELSTPENGSLNLSCLTSQKDNICIEQKSSYRNTYYEKPKDQSAPKKKIGLDINELVEVNPFSIPRDMIVDYLDVRKAKRSPITFTSWTKLHKELSKCVETGMCPIECFETMVSHGWLSLKSEWLTPKSKSETFFDHNSDWGNISGDLFL